MSAGDFVRTACITVLGSGFAWPASGTWGSLVALLLYLPLLQAARGGTVTPYGLNGFLVLGISLAALLSVRWGPWAIARYGRKDPKQFVLDEFAGQWVALLSLPVAVGATPNVLAVALLVQFVLFRIFDILKPPPARQLERLPAGWGILLDDLFAGLYANLCGQALWHFSPLAQWLG